MFENPVQAAKKVFGTEPIFLWKLYWLHREKSLLNTFITLHCLRKQNLLHLDYELFVYELSCLSGQLEETSIIIPSVYKAELLKSPYFSHFCTADIFKHVCSIKCFAMCSSCTQCMWAHGMFFQDRQFLRSRPLGQCVYHSHLVDKIWAAVPD